jgi:hypothetical protein
MYGKRGKLILIGTSPLVTTVFHLFLLSNKQRFDFTFYDRSLSKIMKDY